MRSALSRSGFRTIADWIWERKRFAAATLVGVDFSESPTLGATLAVDSELNIAGDIGAQCDEPAIVDMCLRTLRERVPRVFSLTTDSGAVVHIAVWIPSAAFGSVAATIASGGEDVLFSVPVQPPVRLVIPRRFELVIVGATAFARELAVLGNALDLRIVVVDPRQAFCATMRSVRTAEIVTASPAEVLPSLLLDAAAVLVASHDLEIDGCALRCALQSNAPYIAMLGSMETQETRREWLRREGFDDVALSRVLAAAAADVGVRTVAEIALLVLAQLLDVHSPRALTV